jgi:hypothetical protein
MCDIEVRSVDRGGAIGHWNLRNGSRAEKPAAGDEVEAVAEAISQEWLWLGPDQRERWRQKARLDIAAMRPAGAGWVKCSERMPEPHETVIVHDSKRDSYAVDELVYWRTYPDGSKSTLLDGEASAPHHILDWREYTNVTHWMPLPEPPKEAP